MMLADCSYVINGRTYFFEGWSDADRLVETIGRLVYKQM